MKTRALLIALWILQAFLILSVSASNFLIDYNSVLSRRISPGAQQAKLNLSPTRRKPLSSETEEPETALVAGMDGKIYLLDLDSLNPLWSFASGPAIYSSYQAPIGTDSDTENATSVESDYYIDCGDDWELYAHNRLGKVKLMKTLEEYVSSTPQIAEDGGIVLGSKQTRAFMVDGKTGRLIHTYQMPDSPNTTQYFYKNDASHNGIVREPGVSTSMELAVDALPLYLTRTDYTLTCFTPNSDKILWNLTVAEIGAASLCQDTEQSFDGALLDSDASGGSFNMPLPCQSRALVYRFRNEDLMEAFSEPSRLTVANNPGMMLPASVPRDSLPSQPNVDKLLQFIPSARDVDKLLDLHGRDSIESLPSLMGDAEISQKQKNVIPSIDGLCAINVRIALGFFTSILVGIATYFSHSGKTIRLFQLFSYKYPTTVPLKKKKPRKSGKNGSIAEKRDLEMLLDVHTPAQDETANDLWSSLKKPNALLDGRTIGRLFVSNEQIAKGSNGTVVLEGFFEGRFVAVKRLVKSHHEVAFKEIQNLIASDRHPNIVRWYGVVHDQDFVYLALERCICSLGDLIHTCLGFQKNLPPRPNYDENVMQNKIHLDSVNAYLEGHSLSTTNGYPSCTLLKLMRDMVAGLVHLHELGIVHRDLKPQNILITMERTLCAKLSDMGISKRLVGDMSSLSQHGTGNGSSGWQAPEQLLHGRQTRAVDLFSLGCVLFYCMTGGRHPFGNHLERDVNIVKNHVDLFLVEHVPEAIDLFSHLLNPNPEMRPKAVDVLAHPLFWSSEMRLSFFRDASDRVELEDRETGSEILRTLESTAPMALGGKWNEKMEPAFIDNIGRYRRYKYESVRDLLRVMRNKLNHYRELPKDIQEILGAVPEGFEGYFSNRFPKLLMEVYKVLRVYCREEVCFQKYFSST